MGTQNIPQATDGSVIPAADHNSLRNVLIGDLVPRNTSGSAANESGSLGTSTYQFKAARIKSGYLSVGDIKPHHSFNGSVKCGQGWFPCNGQIINEANYDAYHGAGSWDEYIISSLLENKYSPNLINKYPVGTATTTQGGGSSISSVGNSSHVADISHTHTIGSHVHQWYDNSGSSSTSDNTYNSAGSPVGLPVLGKSSGPGASGVGVVSYNPEVGSPVAVPGDSYTSSNGAATTSGASSASKNIQPESIEVEYYIRIVE